MLHVLIDRTQWQAALDQARRRAEQQASLSAVAEAA
jgi:hypothetical protein